MSVKNKNIQPQLNINGPYKKSASPSFKKNPFLVFSIILSRLPSDYRKNKVLFWGISDFHIHTKLIFIEITETLI